MRQTDVQWTKVDAQFAQWPLRYSLPLKDFTRTIWVSDTARQAWEPRLRRAAQVWRRIEVELARHGRRAAALVALKPGELKPRIEEWQHVGLEVRQIATMPKSSGQSDTVRGRLVGDLASPQVAVGTKTSVARLARACDSGDVVGIGRELGYPECCCKFFETTCVQGQWQDTTWPMAMRPKGRRPQTCCPPMTPGLCIRT